MALFDFNVTNCKTTQKWQKEGHFTTPVPVDPYFLMQSPCTTNKNILILSYNLGIIIKLKVASLVEQCVHTYERFS